MKRHKQYYFEQVPEQPNLHHIVMIMRKPKNKSRFRRIMFLAWHYQYCETLYKKCK